MKYFKKEDFDKCMEFLKDKPDTVETQQELYKFMHEDCHMLPVCVNVTNKDMCIYSKVYATRYNPKTANWCSTMSDGSQVVWNRIYQKFYWIDEDGMNRCDRISYLTMFTELKDIDIDVWILENWSDWPFQEAHKQLFAIWNGKYSQFFRNYWR